VNYSVSYPLTSGCGFNCLGCISSSEVFCWFACVFAVTEFDTLAASTLAELDWCLEQLENIQTHRSVSDMATSKVCCAQT
jgi:hypothetical protein